MPSVGEQIGKYKILSALGAGGMGEVFLAEDTKLERKVALKLLPEGLANDAERMAPFRAGSESCFRLKPSEHHHNLRNRRNQYDPFYRH